MDKEVVMKFPGIRVVRGLTLCIVLLCCSIPVTAQSTAVDPAPAAKPAAVTGKVNLNSATTEQLTTLPGVGPATARLIIEYRTRAGKFNRVEELMNVSGIGEKRFEALKDLLTL